jgi:membrane protease YdiL (CAAX protease family)
MVLWLVSLVVVGPAVEEIYFRGWLLPRLRGRRVLACTTHAALFSVYHLWQPQGWLSDFMFAIPLTVLVHFRRNPALSLVIHSTINLIQQQTPNGRKAGRPQHRCGCEEEQKEGKAGSHV